MHNAEPPDIETLEKRKTKWDRIVTGLKFSLGAYAFIVLTYLAVQGILVQQQVAEVIQQVRDSQLANQTTGTANHEKTRQYVRCIANALLVPVTEREEINFDNCTETVDSESDNTDTQPGSNNQQSVILPPTQSSENKPSEPVATAPPDPEEPQDNTFQVRDIPLVGGLLDLIGL